MRQRSYRFCPPGSFYCIPGFASPFLRMNSNGCIPPAALAHKVECTEQSANQADRQVHDFRYKLTTCKNSRTPCFRKTTRCRMHARNTYVERTEKEKCCILLRMEIKASPSRIIPGSLAALWEVVHFCRVDYDFFVRFENAASCINARRHAGSRQLCLLACIVALWSARACFAALCRADCASLCCLR